MSSSKESSFSPALFFRSLVRRVMKRNKNAKKELNDCAELAVLDAKDAAPITIETQSVIDRRSSQQCLVTRRKSSATTLNNVAQSLTFMEALASACPFAAPLKSACTSALLILRSIDQKRQNEDSIQYLQARMSQMINRISTRVVDFDGPQKKKIIALTRALEEKVEELKELQRMGSMKRLVNANAISAQIANYINDIDALRDDFMLLEQADQGHILRALEGRIQHVQKVMDATLCGVDSRMKYLARSKIQPFGTSRCVGRVNRHYHNHGLNIRFRAAVQPRSVSARLTVNW